MEELVTCTAPGIKFKSISRIGPGSNQNRPILVMFESMEDKGQVMSNLKSLRGVEKFIGISISIDLTREERKFIKGLSEEASRLNNARKEQEKLGLQPQSS